ncbi:MAG TPA: hypothetical protein VIK72_15335 [Clostridiaceae bacterium]
MAKKVKVIYRGIAWFFLSVIAAGSFSGCNFFIPSAKYGPPASTKYGPPTVTTSSYGQNKIKDIQKEIK